jgi:hypothetical protein
MASKHRKPGDTPCMEGVGGQPETTEEMINKYGTYEIQPTCGTENDYPQIAQGTAKADAEKIDKRIRPTQRDGTRL